MLAVRGINPAGNVLHVICGPETDLFMDIHGAKILDVTPLLQEMEQSQPVFLMITRCKNEQMTTRQLDGVGAKFLNSFNPADLGMCPDCEATGAGTNKGPAKGKPEAKKPNSESAGTIQLSRGKCSYCAQDRILLPIPQFKICPTCAQIEIGRSDKKKKRRPKSGDTNGSEDGTVRGTKQ
jgi:hypothetical protein